MFLPILVVQITLLILFSFDHLLKLCHKIWILISTRHQSFFHSGRQMTQFPRTLQQTQMIKHQGNTAFMYVLFSLKMHLSSCLSMRIFQEVLSLIF